MGSIELASIMHFRATAGSVQNMVVVEGARRGEGAWSSGSGRLRTYVHDSPQHYSMYGSVGTIYGPDRTHMQMRP